MTVTHAPAFAPIDSETDDLLALIADVESPVGRDVPALFLAACERDAATHDGLVSVNRVRALLADEDIPPRRYSSLWGHYTGPGRPMVKAYTDGQPLWETCQGSPSRNDGRPFQLRRWIGAS